MNCLDCKKPTQMILDVLDSSSDKSQFEVVFKCPRCNATFFGSFYRDLNQTTGIVDCEDCEGGEDGTTKDEG